MVGMHFDIEFGSENSSSGGCAFFTIYGPTVEEVQAWGEKQTWDLIHDRRPTRYALKRMRSGPVADYLLTESGRQPIDYAEIRRTSDGRGFEEMRRFGLGSSGMVGRGEGTGLSPVEAPAMPTLGMIRAEMEKHIPPGSPQYQHAVEGANWDTAQQALYIFTVCGEPGRDWSEAVLCRAANFYHAASIWGRYETQDGRVRRAGFQLAMGFHAVGEPRLGRRRKR